jgi:hypothetical protein
MHTPAPRRWTDRALSPAAPAPTGPVNRLVERPGPDGIRWGLVHRLRAEIAAGTYDTDAKWAAAQDALLARYGS